MKNKKSFSLGNCNEYSRPARNWILLLGALAVLANPALTELMAQEKPASATEESAEAEESATSALLAKTQVLLDANKLSEAIPFLEQILVRLEGNTEYEALQTKAFVLYKLGSAYLETEQYSEAVKRLEQYLEEFPDDSSRQEGRLLLAESQAMLGEWEKVIVVARVLRNDRKLKDKYLMSVDSLLGEAYYRQESWDEAVEPLLELFNKTDDAKTRNGAAAMLVTCFVRRGDFGNLFKFLPRLNDEARRNIGLNLALIEGGDELFEEGKPDEAAVLYRQVYLKSELIAACKKKIMGVRASIRPFRAGAGIDLRAYKADRHRKELRIQRYRAELAKLQEFRDYSVQVKARIGQAYSDMDRIWPAFLVYRSVVDDYPEDEFAEQSLFACFGLLARCDEMERALAQGREYVDKYVGGQYWDEITLNMVQIYLKRKQFDEALAIGKKSLEFSRENKFVDAINYFMGYAQFQIKEYGLALKRFQRVLEVAPSLSNYIEPAEYWSGMALLFQQQYSAALEVFDSYLENDNYSGSFADDATYRKGVCQYGVGDFGGAEETFGMFVESYPNSTLLSEAYSMLGDLRAAESDLDVALEHYEKGEDYAINVDQATYAVFQSAKVYELEEKYAQIIDLVEEYELDWGDRGGNFAGAAYWIGKSYIALEEPAKALETYYDAVGKYGNDPSETDVDMILQEVYKYYETIEERSARKEFNRTLERRIQAAKLAEKRTLRLRLETLATRTLAGDAGQKVAEKLMRSENIEFAGPFTLAFMIERAVQNENYEFAHQIYNKFITQYKSSPLALDIMNVQLDVLVKEKKYSAAIDLATEITNRFGFVKKVGWTQKRLADSYRMQGDLDQAIETYKKIFSINKWRGDMAPETLYCIGLCYLEKGEPKEAFAFFQRVYVLYEIHTEWVAKAYSKSLDCLEELGREGDIIDTLKEMLSKENLENTPEFRAAQKKLHKLQPLAEVGQ